MRISARKLEDEAKKAKDRNEYAKGANFHLEASKIYKTLNDDKNQKWNCANYYSAKGWEFKYLKEYEKSNEYLKKAEKLFLEIDHLKPAFTCAKYHIKHEFTKSKIEKKGYQQYIESCEVFLDRYEDLNDDKNYISTQINYYRVKSNQYRFEGKYESAMVWAKKCYELAEKCYTLFEDPNYKNAYLYNKHMYLDLKGRKLESEHQFELASKLYEESGNLIEPFDKKTAYDKFVRSYKCKAIKNKHNKTLFIENISKAIDFAKKREDKKQIQYLIGLQNDHLAKFSSDINEKIEFLNTAKESYHQSNNKIFAYQVEYIMSYFLSKKYLEEGEYQKSVDLFNKSISLSKYAVFPNIVPSKSILVNERYLHEFYLSISTGEFSIAADLLNNWLDERKDIKNTKKYKFYEISMFCCKLISSDSYFISDLSDLEDKIQFIKENKLSLVLYQICSLVYSYVVLSIHSIGEKDILNKISLEIIKKFTTEETAAYVKKSLEVENALEDREWLSLIPPKYAGMFDRCIFLLSDLMEQEKYMAFREFYTLIENFIRVIVDFNSKLLWGDKFEEKLSKEMSHDKTFDIFTFGDLLESLKILKAKNSQFCGDISDRTLKSIEKHVELRNKLTHGIGNIDFSGIDISKDMSEIMFDLLGSFPSFIEVLNGDKSPWYRIEINWNQYPKHVNMYYDQEKLASGAYYSEPKPNILENKISPDIMIQIKK